MIRTAKTNLQTAKTNLQTAKTNLQTANSHKHIFILHVDDDASVLDISKLMLQDINSGFEIDHACCVDEAFKKLSATQYDVVVSDYEMPQKNGLDFLKELREQKNDIPFILFTGKGREEVAIRALNLGIDGYFNKQGSPETVYGELCYGIIQTVDRKRSEEALIISEHLNQKILNSTPNLIYIYDLEEHRNVYSNREIFDFLGYTQEQIATMGSELFSNILHPDDAKAVDAHHVRFVNAPDNVAYDVEFRMKHANGEWRWLRSRDTLFSRSKEGLGKQILGVCQDVTIAKQNDDALKSSEEKYRVYTENSPVAFFVVNSGGQYIQVNKAATKLLFYSKNELLKMGIVDILFEKDISGGLKQFATLKETGKSRFKTALKRKDGEPVHVILNATLLPNGNMMAFCENITEHKKAEETLRQERDMLESLTENIGAGLVMVSKDYRILWMNNYLKQLTGASEGKPCYSSFNTCTSICPNCGPKKIFEGASIDRREYCNQTEFNKEHPVWFELIATPIKDKDGNVVAALELTVNITEKKEIEKKLKENSNKIDLMNEKLRVIGSLTRHDVRNKLSAVTGYAYLLKKKHADQPDIVDGLIKMEQAVKDSIKIFDFAKMYEQIGAEQLTYVNVEEKLKEASALFLGPIPTIITECHGLTVLADSFLRQLFYNFIDNTRKYGKKTTTIRVYFEKTDQDCLKLIYEDDGVGIPLENKPKLFKEGFSTGGSTGFGLFLTKKMIDVYGWTITEEGEEGKGAKFVISIPSASVSSFEKSNVDSK
jgi:PAS domain S-box-containing protein